MSCGPLVEVLIFILKVFLAVANVVLKIGRVVFRVLYWAGARVCACGRRQDQRKVVIIGASHSGLMCARWLSWRRDISVTVVDRKGYFEYTPGILRCWVDASYHKHLVCPVSTRGKFILGDAYVEEGALSVDGEPVPFDYLVLACGSSYPGDIKALPSDTTIPLRAATLKKEAEEVAAAEHVIVVGCGLVGAEMAAEVLTYFPGKKVTIIHSSDRVVPEVVPAAQKYVLRWLDKRGANVRLNCGVKPLGLLATSVELEDGEILEGYVVQCFGARAQLCTGDLPSTRRSTLRGSVAGTFDFTEFAKDRHKGYPVDASLMHDERVFCIGDASWNADMNDKKLSHTAELQGMYCAKKIGAILDGRTLKPYPHGLGTDRASDIIAVSLGRYDGVLVWNSFILRGCLVALVKWFIEYTRVLQAADEPIGVLVWYLAHPITFWIDKYGCCLRRRSSAVTSA